MDWKEWGSQKLGVTANTFSGVESRKKPAPKAELLLHTASRISTIHAGQVCQQDLKPLTGDSDTRNRQPKGGTRNCHLAVD